MKHFFNYIFLNLANSLAGLAINHKNAIACSDKSALNALTPAQVHPRHQQCNGYSQAPRNPTPVKTDMNHSKRKSVRTTAVLSKEQVR